MEITWLSPYIESDHPLGLVRPLLSSNAVETQLGSGAGWHG
jgi:hypothetical protein